MPSLTHLPSVPLPAYLAALAKENKTHPIPPGPPGLFMGSSCSAVEQVVLNCLLVNACDTGPTCKRALTARVGSDAASVRLSPPAPVACILLPRRNVPSGGVQMAVLSGPACTHGLLNQSGFASKAPVLKPW